MSRRAFQSSIPDTDGAAQVLRNFHIVSHQDKRCLESIAEGEQKVKNGGRGAAVEIAGRLVCKHQARRAGHGPGDGDSLLLPPR